MNASGIPVAQRVVADEEVASDGDAAALMEDRDVRDAWWLVREESGTLGRTARGEFWGQAHREAGEISGRGLTD